MFFDELPISDELLDALDAMNFTQCTPVQEAAIPLLLQGKDVIACAQTGTGKTAAYILPLLDNLLSDGHDPSGINALIMAPTRELAQQIDQQMEGFSYFLPFSSVAVYGGNDGNAFVQQKTGLTKGADIVIATPGRLLSHINFYNIDFSKVKYFILDEADRMLDMGFFDDIMTIVGKLPANRQTIMFSATMPKELRRLARTFMRNPAEVNIAISRPPETILQQVCFCNEVDKLSVVKQLLGVSGTAISHDNASLVKVLLFAGKKTKVRDIYYALYRSGINARQMHSDLTQAERDAVMLDFRNGKVGVLVATDIVARGIDIEDIPLVINYDVPHDAEDYVHRIGRTARAENSGRAVTLVSEQDIRWLAKIEKLLNKQIERLVLSESFTPPATYTAEQKKPRKTHHNNRFVRHKSRKS